MQLKLNEISAEMKTFTIDNLHEERLVRELPENCLVYAEFYHQICMGKYFGGNIYLGSPASCKGEMLGEDVSYLREIRFFWQRGEVRCIRDKSHYICRKIEDKEQRDSYYILQGTHKLWGTAMDTETEPGWSLLRDGRGSRILIPAEIAPGTMAGIEICHYIEYGKVSQAGEHGWKGLQHFKARRLCGLVEFTGQDSLRKTFSQEYREGRG